ncbi:MAG: ATP-binding cassette domain-containing protein [Alistipes sp.]|nr:ATP-binding cassette domain-containing protein [Alistipes sp.]MBR2014101.1 ATP-binding cassette domain-containing protein [Alistipes sp.]
MNILQANNITKHYTAHTALDNVSVEIPRGSVYGLLGPNGAGKTTLIRVITRITLPDAGEVLFDGRKITDEDIFRIGYLPEERGLYKKMKVGEQAIFFARLRGLSRHEAVARLKVWFERFNLQEWWDRKVEDLSKGMAQKVQFIATVVHQPKLLIFDEPFSGFDPINANLLKQEILRLRDEGSTVIFSTHNMSSVEEICDHITLINRSRNILSGEVGEVRRRYGENIFSLRYRGDEALLRGGLDRVAEVLAATQLEQGLSEMKFRLGEGVTMHDAIHIANEAVEIRSLEEVIPSMNDIFIRAVEGTL